MNFFTLSMEIFSAILRVFPIFLRKNTKKAAFLGAAPSLYTKIQRNPKESKSPLTFRKIVKIVKGGKQRDKGNKSIDSIGPVPLSYGQIPYLKGAVRCPVRQPMDCWPLTVDY